MSDELTVEIDGVEVKAKPGTMIIQAAADAGMYIPYLCYYPGMKPFGACRMCVVEIEGSRGTPASCTTPVAEGMAVHTKSPEIVSLRRGIMDMLLSEHPHGCLTCHRIELCGPADICLRHVSVNDRCVTCPKNERCELKDTVRHLEMDMDTPLAYNNRELPLKVDDPYWEMDMNLCIVCARCVRVCEETRTDDAITLLERSGRTLIGTSHGTSLLESGCEFCGACIDVCPTGALVERDYKWEKAVKKVASICPHCPVGCQMNLEVNKRNRLIRAVTDINAPANRGQMCFKGKFGLDFVNHKERLRNPLVRRNGLLEETSWESALDVVAAGFADHKDGKYAIVASPRGTNEDNYLAQKFARVVMKSNNIDISSNLRPELVRPLGELLGYPAATNSIWELENSEGFLVVGSNMTEEQNVVAVPLKKAVRGGSILIVIDPRETELSRHATIWLRPKPGTESILIGGMLRVIMDESLDDHEFIANGCDNLDGFKNALWTFDLLKVERITAIPQEEIRAAARLFASTKPSAILYGLETMPFNVREDCVRALVNLSLVTGNLGKPSAGLFPLFPGANEQGSKDVGCAPDGFPGYQNISDDGVRQRLYQAWGEPIRLVKGLGIKSMPNAIRDGEIKVLQVIGDSANFTNGELSDFMEVVKNLDFLVIQDSFASRLTEYAHVVLPSATFAEKEGTYTNLERRVQRLHPALSPSGEEKPDWQIISQIAIRMGANGFDYVDAEAVFKEISNLMEIYGGMSYQRLQASGLQWPCMDADTFGTPILWDGLSGTHKARLGTMIMSDTLVTEDFEYPLQLAMGRVLHQPDRKIEIVKANGRNTIVREDILEIHPEDAGVLEVADGDWIEAVSPKGRISGVARLSSPHRGLISTTLLFGQLITELESSELPDPMLDVPTLSLLPARIEKLADVVTST